MKFLLPLLILITAITSSPAQEKPASAADLAAKLSTGVLDNSSTARLKMDIIPAPGGEKTVLQLKVNARRTKAASDVHYQVLWPKERKTDSFVLRKPAGQPAKGETFQPPDAVKSIASAQLQDGIFGSDLAYEDLVDNYFGWENQEITGEEAVNRVPCIILLSKPGPGDQSGYTSVKTWIDTKRMVPLQIEKYGPGGQIVRRITITLVAKDDLNRLIPANFAVERPGRNSRTVLEGSNIKHGVKLTDADFSPEVLRVNPPKPE
ncbi:MAG: outer membrane lipoprotein-sorting protein [Terrimicrobiaceae bacterium]